MSKTPAHESNRGRLVQEQLNNLVERSFEVEMELEQVASIVAVIAQYATRMRGGGGILRHLEGRRRKYPRSQVVELIHDTARGEPVDILPGEMTMTHASDVGIFESMAAGISEALIDLHYQTDLLAKWQGLDGAASLNRRLKNIPRRIQGIIDTLDELEGWAGAATRGVDPESASS